MKKILLIILLSVPAIFSLLKPGFYQSLDGINNASRLAAFFTSLIDGQFIPRWASNLNFGFGHPVLIFQYPLPNYIGSAFHLLGYSFTDSIKLVLILSTLLSAVFFYFWLSEIVDKKSAVIGSLLYTYAPYKFIDIYVRNSWGEILALTFIPLALYLVEKMLKKNNLAPFFLSVVVAMIVLSHNVIALMFIPVLILYITVRFLSVNTSDLKSAGAMSAGRQVSPGMEIVPAAGGTPTAVGAKDERIPRALARGAFNTLKINKYILLKLIIYQLPALFGILICSFFWMPALLEAKYTTRDLLVAAMYRDHFPTLGQLINSPWGFGISVKGTNDQMSFMVGLGQWIAILISLIVLVKGNLSKNIKILSTLFILLFSVSIFLMLQESDFIWQKVILMQQFQFPWRFLSFSVLFSAAAAALSFNFISMKISPKYFNVIILLTIVLTILFSKDFLGVKGPIIYTDKELLSYTGTTTWFGENNSVWTAGEAKTYAKKPMEIIEGSVVFKNYEQNTTQHKFSVTSSVDSKIVDNTVYFPGWQVLIDGKKVPIEFQDPNYRGLITFNVPKGEHRVKISFEESKVRKFADYLSLFSLFALISFTAVRNRLLLKNES